MAPLVTVPGEIRPGQAVLVAGTLAELGVTGLDYVHADGSSTALECRSTDLPTMLERLTTDESIAVSALGARILLRNESLMIEFDDRVGAERVLARWRGSGVDPG